jgi:hypothetical protein
MRGWEVANKINLSERDGSAACELCGTPFRRGAVVVRHVPRVRKRVTLTIGGYCLVMLLEHEFGDPKEVAKRRTATTRQIVERYRGLADAGAWVVWVYEHAPTELADAAVRLRHLGIVRSNAELRRLIAFHDANRKYAAEAVLPMADALRGCGVRVPKSITLDQARRLLAGMSEAKRSQVLGRLGERYLHESGPSNIEGWDDAWRSASQTERRLIAAMAAISDSIQDDGSEVWKNWLSRHVRLAVMASPASSPRFAWNRTYGLCLLAEEAVSSDSTVEVFLWGRNAWARFRVSALHAVTATDVKSVLPLEREVFWQLPIWCAKRTGT